MLTHDKGGFHIARLGRCREQRERPFRCGLRDMFGARPRVFRREGCEAIKLLGKNVQSGHAGGTSGLSAQTIRLQVIHVSRQGK